VSCEGEIGENRAEKGKKCKAFVQNAETRPVGLRQEFAAFHFKYLHFQALRRRNGTFEALQAHRSESRVSITRDNRANFTSQMHC
jgi:hypothetical protein